MATYRPGWIAMTVVALAVVFLFAPLVAVVPTSFTPNRYLSLPEGEWSLRHYRTLLEVPEWRRSVLLSLWIGIVSSVVATTLATAFAVGVWLVQPRFTAALVGFVLMPMIVPPVVSAVTLYFLLTSLSGVSTAIGYDTWPGVVIAHVVMIAPFAVVLIFVALARVDRRIDMAARGMGANLRARVLEVILPNIRFGVMTALFLTFVLSWEEIAVTLFVTSVNAITLPRLVWTGLRDNVDPAVAAISVVLIAITVVVVAAVVLGRSLADRRRAP